MRAEGEAIQESIHPLKLNPPNAILTQVKNFFENWDEGYINLHHMQMAMPELYAKYMSLWPRQRKDFARTDEFASYFQNSDQCAKHKGFCCKQQPCSILANDFESYDFETLRDYIDRGDTTISIAPRKSMFSIPLVGLAVRGRDDGIIRYGERKIQPCTQLTKDGCKYDFDNRPSGGVLVIPRTGYQCIPIMNACYANHQLSQDTRQEVLQRILEYYHGDNRSFAEIVAGNNDRIGIQR